jgi:toxin ParE1/3/4
MRRLPVELSAQALADIAEIRSYLRREAGPAVSTRVLARIRKTLASIERSPTSGAPRPEFGESARLHVSGAYVIYVQVRADRVDVLRILHAARDRGSIMSKREEAP